MWLWAQGTGGGSSPLGTLKKVPSSSSRVVPPKSRVQLRPPLDTRETRQEEQLEILGCWGGDKAPGAQGAPQGPVHPDMMDVLRPVGFNGPNTVHNTVERWRPEAVTLQGHCLCSC